MPDQCKFPLCKRNAVDNGLCIGHQIYASENLKDKPDEPKPKPQPKQKPIPKRSKKQKKVVRDLTKIYEAFLSLPENQFCAIKSPVCQKMATTVNHKRRRGKNVTNVKDMQPSCAPCNTYIESHSAWAYKHGHLEKVHTKK